MEKQNSPSYTWIYGVALALALAVFGVGIYLGAQKQGWAMLAVGCGSVVAVLITWPVAYYLSRLPDAAKHEELLVPFDDRMQQIAVLLNLVSEQQLLSDRAKSVAFREKDRDALRRAIREEMARQDWEAALVLAGDMEAAFGYKSEADRFREEINGQRQEAIRRQVAEAVGVIDRHCRAEKWSEALREAEKVMQQFAGVPQVQNLPQEIEARRQQHKKQMVGSWEEAVTRKDVDGAIEILKKLDIYLTPSEAEGMQETARTVFKAKLEQLRAQFSSSVQDRNWTEAIRIGEVIIRDFPNTRIAQEVQGNLTTLRQRAAEGAGVAEPAGVA